ncbi:hypothetical protein [Saccharothrix lopnurensis]|uniref:Uncharacterized protein n=1 Tax=Saccharothrix lopnurensis TaxID=1670621 RepID=A0ABW1P366_9PSEU
MRTRHLRRYAVAVFDDKGRISDRTLFAVLGWDAGTRRTSAGRASARCRLVLLRRFV